MIGYKIESKREQRQDCDMFNYNVKNDSKAKKELQVLETCAIIAKEKEKANKSELQEQMQLSVIVIKENADKTELPKQKQHNVIIIKLPEVEKMGEVSKQLYEIGFGANKEKAGEGRKFEKVGTLKGKIQEEKKPSDETVFNANKEKAGEAEELEKNINLERKMLVFGHSAKVIAKTESLLEEKKPPDLSKLNQNANVKIV